MESDDRTSGYPQPALGGPDMLRASLARLLGEGSAALDALAAALRAAARSCEPGALLVREGERSNVVRWVLEGWLSLEKLLPDGRRQLVDLALAGEPLRSDGAGGSPCGVRTLTAARVAVQPLAQLGELMTRHAALAALTGAHERAREARYMERLLRIGKSDAQERIAYAMLELAVRLEAIGGARQGRFELPLTQGDLGDFTGLTNVHVCRVLGRLQDEGILLQGDADLVVIGDLAALEGLADVSIGRLRATVLPRVEAAPPPIT